VAPGGWWLSGRVGTIDLFLLDPLELASLGTWLVLASGRKCPASLRLHAHAAGAAPTFGLVWTTAYRWMVDTVATRPTTAHFFFAAAGHDYPRARSSPASTGVHNYERVHYLLGLIFYRFAFAKFIIYMICISPLRIRPEPRRISISSRPSLRPAFYSIPSGWLTFLDRNIPLHRGPTT
jgi:hypothetical protein